MIVNFDNAATTFPKPPEVRRALNEAILRYGGNAGRGGHRLTLATSEKVYDTRQSAADFSELHRKTSFYPKLHICAEPCYSGNYVGRRPYNYKQYRA